MNATSVHPDDWNRLQRQIGRLWLGLVVLAILVVALAVCAWIAYSAALRGHGAGNNAANGILRTHGIVVVDAQGHDRILIGAPAAASTARTRKDDSGSDIVFLGTDGADRLVVGQTPSPIIGGKVYPRRNGNDNYGLTLYDTHGSERGGMGFMGDGRAAIALDRAAPLSDAIGMMVDDKEGFAGMIINYADGKVEAPAIELGTTANEAHIQFYGKDNLLHAALNVEGGKKPAWQLDDAASAAQAAQAAKAAQH